LPSVPLPLFLLRWVLSDFQVTFRYSAFTFDTLGEICVSKFVSFFMAVCLGSCCFFSESKVLEYLTCSLRFTGPYFFFNKRGKIFYTYRRYININYVQYFFSRPGADDTNQSRKLPIFGVRLCMKLFSSPTCYMTAPSYNL